MSLRVVEVVVRGRLGADLVAALDGFAVVTDDDGLTTITGAVPDQTRLIGMLDMFDDLHLQVVSVNPVEAVAEDSHPTRVTSGGRTGS